MESLSDLQTINQQQIQQMSDQELLDIVKKDTDFDKQVLEFKKKFKGTDFVIALHGLSGQSMYTETTTIEELKENIKSYIDAIREFKKQIVILNTGENPNVVAKYNSQKNLDVCDVYIAKCNEILQNDYQLKSAIEQKIAIDKEQCPVLSILEDEIIQKNNSIVQISRGVFNVKIDGKTRSLTLLEIGYTHEHTIPLNDQMIDSNKEEEKSSLTKVAKSALESDSEELSEINTNSPQNNDRSYDVKKITLLNQYKQDTQKFYLYKNEPTEYPFIIEYQNGGKINIDLSKDIDVQNLKNYIHKDEGKIVLPVTNNLTHPLKEIDSHYYTNDILNEAEFCEGRIKYTFVEQFTRNNGVALYSMVQYVGAIPTPTTADGELTFFYQNEVASRFNNKLSIQKQSIVKGKWNIDNNGNWRAQGDVFIEMIHNTHNEKCEIDGTFAYFNDSGYSDRVVIEITGKTQNGLLEGNTDVIMFDKDQEPEEGEYTCGGKYQTQIIFTKGEAAKEVQIQRQLQHGRLEITTQDFSIIQNDHSVKDMNNLFYNNPNTLIVHYDKDGNETSNYTGETNEDFTPNNGLLFYANGDIISFVKQISRLSPPILWDARLKIKNQDGFDYQFILLPNQSQCIYLSKDYLKIDNTKTCEITHKGFYYRGEHVNLVPNGDGNIQTIQKVKYKDGVITKELSSPAFPLEVINVANRIDREDVSKEEEKSSSKPQEMHTHLAGQKRQAVTPIEYLVALNQSHQPLLPLQRAVGIYQNQQDYEQQPNINVQSLFGHGQIQPQIPNQVTEPQGPAFNTRSRRRDDKTNDKSFGKK